MRVLVVALCALTVACVDDGARESRVRFTQAYPGVEYARFFATDGPASFDGHAFVIDLAAFDARAIAAGAPSIRRNVATIVRAFPVVVATNGSFFAEDGRAMGLVVDEGRRTSKRRIKKWGALVVDEGKAVIEGGDVVDLARVPDVVVQGQPFLVRDGEIPPLKEQAAERTAVCLRAERPDALVLVVTSQVDAMALARFLARPIAEGGLACHDALNLDGGPSTQLYARLGALSVSVDNRGEVPNALVLLPKHARVVGDELEGPPPKDGG